MAQRSGRSGGILWMCTWSPTLGGHLRQCEWLQPVSVELGPGSFARVNRPTLTSPDPDPFDHPNPVHAHLTLSSRYSQLTRPPAPLAPPAPPPLLFLLPLPLLPPSTPTLPTLARPAPAATPDLLAPPHLRFHSHQRPLPRTHSPSRPRARSRPPASVALARGARWRSASPP